MRIIGGEASGRSIPSPRGRQVRPTPDRVRESLFNILHPLEGLHFLDLYAGTGSVGLEALSRGAERVVFIEKNPGTAAALKATVEKLGFGARTAVLGMDVKSGISRLSKEQASFHVIFADPPYERDLIERTLASCERGGLMAPDGLMIVQRSRREPFNISSGASALQLYHERHYGDTVVSFLKFHHEGALTV